jgi:type III pantothenate kinase
MVLLAIDIGNTNIVVGVFHGGSLTRYWRIATDSRRMPDEYAVTIESLFRMAHIEPHPISGAVIASVVPAVESAISRAIREYWGVEPLVVTTELDLGIRIEYVPMHSVGADRVANAIATIHRHGAPAIVVDFGTATTFDAISADRAYVGGAIAPGLEVSEAALSAATSQLPRVAFQAPPRFIENTTVSSLQSGLMRGYAALVDGLVDGFRGELGDAVVIATGGLAQLIAPLSRTIQHVHLDLTLQGLYLIYEHNVAGVVGPGARQN